MRFFSFFDKIQPYMRALDWAGAIGSLGYGIWRGSIWWIVAGVIMLGLAWYDPGTRIKRYAAFIKPAAPTPAPVTAPVSAPQMRTKPARQRPARKRR